MASQVRQLIKDARRSGIDVSRTNGDHLRFRCPDGKVVISPSTPSEYRSITNTRALLKHHGLGADRRQDMPKTSNASGNVASVLDALSISAGKTLQVADIVSATGLSRVQVSNSLQYLVGRHPEVNRVGKGTYVWAPKATKRISQSVVEAVAVETPAATRPIKVIPAALPTDVPTVFEAITVHDRSKGLVLRDENGELWLAHALQVTPPTVAFGSTLL